jgi:hypothetical protein
MDNLQFLFNAYPEGIAMEDEEGLLPLHYAGTRPDKNIDIIEFITAATPTAAQGQARKKVAAKAGEDKECAIM